MTEVRRLYRADADAMIGGVCAGLARYLGADVALVRLGAVVGTIFFLPLLLVYLVAWIIVPRESGGAKAAAEAAPGPGQPAPAVAQDEDPGARPRRSPELIAGLVLVVLGLFFLAERFDVFDTWFFRWMTWGTLWPLALVAAGVYLVVRGLGSSGGGDVEKDAPPGGTI